MQAEQEPKIRLGLRQAKGKRLRWRQFLVLVLVLVRARQWPRAALTTRASGHIKLKFQLEIAQLLLPVHPWPNCSHAPQQIASAWAWAWAWVWAADEARTAVARWKWMLRCPWCDAMCCHVNWQHLRRNLSQDQPADTFNLVRRRDTAEAPMCPNPHCDAGSSSRLADAIWCQVLPLELIMLALSDTLLTSALTFCGFFLSEARTIYYTLPITYARGKGEFH